MTLQMFTNHTDTVVAEDLSDVQRIIEKRHGTTFEQEGWSLDEWGPVPDDKMITIHNFDGHDGVLALTARQWIERDGRDFFASTEW